MGAKHFGARVARLEDPALLTGRGRFVGDIALAGMLHACFVRSPHAHAKIRAIDTAAARAMPGVHAVLTADDLPPAMALEGRGVLASCDAGTEVLTVWSSTQTPHLCRATLADLLRRELESIRVIAPFVGGGFGTKAPFYAEEAVVPAAAMKLECPIL